MSDNEIFKLGLKPSQLFELLNDIQVNPGAIVSKILRKSPDLNLTLFAFDQQSRPHLNHLHFLVKYKISYLPEKRFPPYLWEL